MPRQTTAITQNEVAYIDTDRPATQSTAVQKKTDTENYHLFRQASASKQPNRPLTKGKPRLGPSHDSINSALSAIKPPASWSSAPLLEALTTYCEDSKKADRLTQDLTKPGLRDFLSLDESELCLKQDQLTKQEFDTFIKALANEGHGSSSSLTKLLKKAWRLTQKESGAQQTSHTSAPLQEALIRYCKDNEKASCLKQDVTKPELRDFLSLDESVLRFKQAQLTKQEFDTFIEVLANAGHGSKSSLTKKLKTAWDGVQQAARDSAHPAQDRAHPASISILAPSDPFDEDKNSTEAPSETATTEALRTDSTLSKSAELNPNKYKIYADAKADSVEQTQPSNVSATLPKAIPSANTLSAHDKNPFAEDDDVSHTSSTSPQAETSADLLPKIVLDSLNNYLRTLDGSSFGDVNKAHVKKIEEDIANNDIIRKYLILNNNKLEWRNKEVVFTNAALKLLLDAFKAEHKKGRSMYKVLFSAFEILNAADKAAGDSALHSQDSIQSAKISTPSGTTPASSNEGLSTDSAPNKSADSYLDEYNPFANAEADNVEQTQTSNSSTTSSAAPIFLQLLNKYIKTKDRQWGESINEAHVKKMERDITENSTIGELLILKDKQLQWTRNNVTDGDLHSLLNEFRKLHNGGKSSLLRVLSDSKLPALGFQMLDAATLKNIIQKAAEPAPHMPGSGEVVKMKRDAMTKALEFFSAPENHEKPLPTGVLDQLIEHYGRTKKDLDKLQKSLKEIKSEQTLNDDGFLDMLKRYLGFFKPEERLERFSEDVATLDTRLRTKMLSWLDKVQTEHPPESVSTRTNNMLIKCQKEAHDLYAEEITGTNIFSEKINPATIQQIVKQAQKNSHTVLKEIIAGYGKKFIDNLTNAISVFSVSNYLKGTSRKEAADDIIAINKKLDSLYGFAQTHHKENIRQVTKKLSDSDIIEEINRDFESLEQGLADSIQAKVLDNCKHVLSLYDKGVTKIKVPLAGNFSKEETNSKALRTLSNELSETITKIRSTSYKNCSTLEKENLAPKLNEAIKEVTQPLVEKIKNRLPKLESIGTTLISAFKRAFEPTPAKILGCIPLIGGLTLALTTLPKLIAIPLGITAAVVLPFALLGWVGWNIYNCFNQRSNIKQTLKTLETINLSTAK
ncbi:hypothetical protein NPS46_10810 [Pseudomonas putida]|uniref:hypothetical protein n=1 Tax=Pseudomonas putida TaxID=303 RepID=UPI0023638408|nr:hypothetical protein [Pseudomonas putida]MDD2053034.1 hypothetical protein [Pseudomonas putida]